MYVNIKVNLPIASPIRCSQFQPKLCSRSGISANPLHFEVDSGGDMVLRPLQQLLRVCALVQAGGTSMLMTLLNCMVAFQKAISQEGSQDKIETSHRHQVVAVVLDGTLQQEEAC